MKTLKDWLEKVAAAQMQIKKPTVFTNKPGVKSMPRPYREHSKHSTPDKPVKEKTEKTPENVETAVAPPK